MLSRYTGLKIELYNNLKIMLYSNNKIVFFLVFDLKTKKVYKFCFFLFTSVIFFQFFKNFFCFCPKIYYQTCNNLRNEIIRSFLLLHFPLKSRLRFSGLGFGLSVSSDKKNVEINAGFTKSPLLFVPSYILDLRTNKKKKKVLLSSFFYHKLNSFTAQIRSLKPCDVYKHKGIR